MKANAGSAGASAQTVPAQRAGTFGLGATFERPHRTWPVVGVAAAVLAFQVALATGSMELLSAVQSYVGGESLYSKGQKEAQMALRDYLADGREEDFARFKTALTVPIGDRVAREALQQPEPDPAVAHDGFLAGGNDPADIGRLIWSFQWFHETRLLAPSIALWTAGDHAVQELDALADHAHERVHAGASEEELGRLRREAIAIDERLTRLERDFSARLATTSREMVRWLMMLNLISAVVLGVSGLTFMRQRLHERTAAEQEIRRRRESLQQLLDSTAEGLVGIDANGRCTFINRSGLEILGHDSPHAVVGRDTRDWLQDASGRATPIDHAIRHGQPAQSAEARFLRRDGRPVPVTYWCHPVISGGRPDGGVITFFDISSQLHAREALRDSEARLARLVDAVGDAVISADARRCIVLFNRAAETIFRTRAPDRLGADFLTLFDPASVQHLSALLEDPARLGAARAPQVHELRALRGDGENFPAEVSISRVQTDTGMLTTIILRDASGQEQMRQEREARMALEASNHAKTGFLSRVSHELRTPLNAVIGFARLMSLDDSRPLRAKDRERIDHIENAGQHLLALVNDVLDLSRVESGQLALSLEPVDVMAAAEEALAVAVQLARDGGVMVAPTVRIEREPGEATRLALVLADRVRLRQVLINLVSNAVKYTPAGGRVDLAVRSIDDRFELIVTDTGQGMTGEQMAHLFEPFNRLGAERSTIEGTGIGLVLTRHLVALMDGTLDIRSAPGRGTVATVQLRRAQADLPETGAAPRVFAAAADEVAQAPLDVIYAEDNEVNIELMRQVVQLRPGVALRVATSGGSALEMARARPPRLMLVDMQLGDMTGLEVAAQVRADPATAGVGLVAVSADALPEQIDAAMGVGFDEYLTKPINVVQIMRVLAVYGDARPQARGGTAA